MKILVVGANGQIGWELIRQAKCANCELIALDRKQLDITDKSLIQKVFDEQKPRIVINVTGYTAVDRAEKEREIVFAVNRDGVRNLAEICANHNIPLVHISTDYVFDGTKGEVYTEDDPVSPLGVYGRSKWEGEEAVRDLLERYIILRTSWVFGVHGSNFLKTIIKHAQKHKEISVVCDQYGGPTPANLVAGVILIICNSILTGKAVWGTYHLSGMPHTTWYGFAQEIINVALESRLLTSDVVIMPIATSQYKTLAKRPPDSRLCNDKIDKVFQIKELSYKPSIEYVISQLDNQEECYSI